MMGLLVMAVSSGRYLVAMVLITGGFPITILVPGTYFLQFAGGIAPQAVYLFAIILALFIALIFNSAQILILIRRWYLFFGFLVFAAVSLVWADNFVYGLRFLAKLMAPFLLAAAVTTFFSNERDLTLAERAILICCIAVLALAIVNHLSGGALGDLKNQRKWVASNTLTAPYMSPANFSFLLGTGAVLCMGKLFERRRAAYVVLLGMFVGAIFWAYTRIAIAGVAIGCVLVLMVMIRSRPLKLIVPAVLGVAFLAVLISSPKFQERMFFAGTSVDASRILKNPTAVAGAINTSGRTHLWGNAAWQFRAESKIEGAGLGSVDAWLDKKYRGLQLHSDYYRLYLDLGVMGVALFSLALMQILLTSSRLNSPGVSIATRRRSASAIGAVALYAVTLATDNTLNYVTEFGFYVFALAGMAIVSFRLDAAKEANNAS